MTVLSRISNHYRNLSPAERKVADVVLQAAADVLLMPLHALARQSDVSEATVIRFCRSVGYTGYQDFKSSLIPDVLHGSSYSPAVEPQGDYEKLKQRLKESLGHTVASTLAYLERETLDDVTAWLSKARHVMIVGLAGSAGVGRVMMGTLMTLGIPTSLYADRVDIERISVLCQRHDVLFAISHSGETEEVCVAVERARANGAHTIALTNTAPSRLSSLAHRTLLTSLREPVLGSYSCGPRLAQLAVLELVSNLLIAAKTDAI